MGKLTSPITYGATTLFAMGGLDVLAHLGPTGLVFGGIAAIVAARHGKEITAYLKTLFPEASEEEIEETVRVIQTTPASRSLADRLLGRYPEEPVTEEVPKQAKRETYIAPQEDEDVVRFDETFSDEDDLPHFPRQHVAFHFSEVLSRFTPTLANIYLASLPDGTPLYCPAKSLCHVALAGATGGGKTSIMRLLMSQLCKAGASVLLLNPHYTHYDLEHDEDWTPFLPYLARDPMECRDYNAIAFFIKSIATDLLPKRLDKFARSQPLGKPYFVVIDELPAILSEKPEVAQHLAKILREGRKVGIFVIVASQDFLVSTIAPSGSSGGGAIRECYRTTFYVGGDGKTASVLLDMPAKLVPEERLGTGVIMVRCAAMKKAGEARVPYVDNQALYRLLGPSTYRPTPVDEQDNQFIERLTPEAIPVPDIAFKRPYIVPSGDEAETERLPRVETTDTTGHFTSALTPLERAALELYEEGMTFRGLAQKMTEQGMEIGKDKAGELIKRLKAKKLIA